ncbi:long-chain-fatty-acid--CoA ligase [Bacillus sp. OAE603]|uniref:long-chain-fatty-acid--CoA ligase n=1 Tax=Gottfriedia sp. OAE603 TaxID=2663872 RepID=UPI00178A15CC
MDWNLNERLSRGAENYPNKAAVLFENEKITYRELNEYVDRLACNLASSGIRKGDKVALILGNCPEFIITYYGILRAGGVVVPINPIYSHEEISYILANSKTKAVIAHSLLETMIVSLMKEMKSIEKVYYVETNHLEFAWEQLIAVEKSEYDFPLITEEDLAVILYTSGTTGRPKGAMLSQRNLCSNAESIAQLTEFTADDRILAVLPMFHIFCMSVCINAPIICGGTIVISEKFSPIDVIKTIMREKVTLFAGVPTMYSILLQLEGYSADHFKTLRICLSGGASLPIQVLQRFEKKYKVNILEGFGCTETAPVTAFNPLNGIRKVGSVGIDIPSVMNKIVDPVGNEVPRGEIGELVVKGPNVMLGYLGMPDETYASIKNGWFHTGDLAKMDEDGYIYIVDRMKDMIIVGGYNVYPREVEEVLYKHPAIIEAVVIGVPDPIFGEQVKAFVVRNDHLLSTDDLIVFCNQQLAKYKVPKEIEIINEMPKNSTGKILRRELRKYSKTN